MTKKITQLPAATTPLAGTELLEIVQGGVSSQVAVSDLGGGGGTSTGATGVVQTSDGASGFAAGYDKHATNLVQASKPRVGDSTMFASEGRAEQAMGDANQTLGASIYSRFSIRTTGAITAARTATLPLPASEDGVVFKPVKNDCTGDFNVVFANGGGTSTSLPPDAKALLVVAPGGVQSAINTVEYLQFVGADASRLPTFGLVRVDPYNGRDIIVTRTENDSGDLVLLSHWTPAAGKNELAVGNGQAVGTQVSRLVLSGADFVRALAGSYTAWRASSSQGVQFHSDTEDFGGGQKVIGIDNATTNPTTNPTGGIVVYVDSADNTLKYRKADGTTVSLGGGGSVGGANTQVLFNDSGAEAGDAGLTYAKATDALSVAGCVSLGPAPANAGLVRLSVGGGGTQEWFKYDYSGSTYSLAEISGGVVVISNTGFSTYYKGGSVAALWGGVGSAIFRPDGARYNLFTDANGMGLFGSPNYGGGVDVLWIANRTTAPTSNPTGGGLLYAEAGAGKWRGSGGTVTTFGPADPHCPRCGTDVGISQSENDLFGEELVHCHACELKTGNGVVRHFADFFDRKKAA